MSKALKITFTAVLLGGLAFIFGFGIGIYVVVIGIFLGMLILIWEMQ